MKFVVRTFFKTLRIVLGPFMLLWEAATRPRGLARAPAAQQWVDEQCQSLVLYQFSTCPFCIKVRQEMRRLSLRVDKRDVQKNLPNREQLIQGGGAYKVPCLHITSPSGQSQWIYESGQIISYLQGRFEGA